MQEIELENEPSCLSVARSFVSDYLDELRVPEGEAFDILLALNEAVANAHRHGRRDHRGRIRILCGVDDDGTLTLIVRDDGHGFDYRPTMAEMPGPMVSGGRGLSLMKGLMDHFDVRTDRTGTEVSLQRRVPVGASR